MAKGKGGGAPYGNKNASKGGARSAVVGAVIGGPFGAGVSGTYVGLTKNQVGINRHTKTSTGIGAAGGALYGGLVGSLFSPAGAAIGAGLGALGGGALNYGGAKIGQAIGRNVVKKSRIMK